MMSKQQQEYILDQQRKSQLDENIRLMIDGGASNEDVMKYASDFKIKFGQKKNESSNQDSTNGAEISGQPSVPSPEFEASNAAYAAEADNRLAAQAQRRQEEDRQNNFPINLRLEGPSKFSGGVGDIFKPLKFGETPDWEGAQSRKLSAQIASWQAANPDMEYTPVRLFEEINQGEIKQAVPSSWGKNMVRRGAHIYNGLLHGIGSLANFAVDTGLSWQAYTTPGAGGVISDLALSNYRANIAPNVRNALVDVIGVDMSDAEGDRWNSEFVTGGLAGLAGTAPAMVGSKLRMTRMFMLGADAALNSIEEADSDGKISNLSKTVYSTAVGSAVAALEKAGFDRIFKSAPSSLATFVAQKTISDAAKSGGGKVTGDAVVRFLNSNLAEVSNKYARGGVAAVEGMITEFATGSSQEIATIGSEGVFNFLSGENIFDMEENSWDGFMNYVGRVGEAGIMEAVGGGVLGSASGIMSASSRKRVYNKIQQVESLRKDLDNPSLSDADADAVLKTLLDAMFDLRNDLGMSLSEFNSLVEDAKQRVQGMNEQILSAQDVIDSPNTSDEAKEAAEARIAEIGAEIEEIASDPQNKVDTVAGQAVEGQPQSDGIAPSETVTAQADVVAPVQEESPAETPADTSTEPETVVTQEAVSDALIKQKQLSIIQGSNPAPNEINTWIRSVADIKTASEAFLPARTDGEMFPDFSISDMDSAIESGELTVYSSYPIKEGVFVTPSKMNAESYSGDGSVYSKNVNLTDVAWIDEGEGQYAPVPIDSPLSETTPVDETIPQQETAQEADIERIRQEEIEVTTKALEGVDTQPLKKQLGIEANWSMIGEGDALSGNDPTLAYTQKHLPDWNRESQKGNINPNSKITYDIPRTPATSPKTLPSGYVLEGMPEVVNKEIVYAKDENGVIIGMVEIETLKDGRNGIKHIAVAPEFRGKGVADKLIQALKENNPQLDLSKTKLKSKGFEKAFGNKIISEAYHKAKADGSNPELVEAVEKLIGNNNQSSLNTPTFFETVTDSESRKTRIEQLKQSLSDSLKADQNLGIFQDNRSRAKRDIDFLRDLTELAILSIADGTVKTAEAFRNLAKGIGDFGDDVLNRAYTAATQSVEEYQTWARPRETTDARVGELLTRMQDLDVDRAPAKTKIRPKQVRELTGGGIKGKVDLTNRQALREQIKTLNRGIRDGKAQIIEARKAITDFINEMKDQGLFKGKVRGEIIKPLLDNVNRANTPAALSNALAYAEKASKIIDYDQKRAKAENNKKSVKKASKGRGMPQDLKAVMTDISNINLTYVENIEQFNDMTDRLLDAVKGMGIDGIWTEDFVKLKESVDKKIKQAKENRLRDELVNAGMDQDFVDGLNTLDQLMEALATLPEGSKARSSESLRSIRERALQQTLPMLEEMDRTGFTDKQNAIIDALLGLDVSKISDGMLPSVVIAAKNIAVNGSFLGTGPIEVEHKLQQRTGNTKDAANIKKTVASPRKWLAKLRDRLGTVSTQIDSVLKNRDVVGSFMRMTGFGDYLAKYNTFVDRYNAEVRDKIAEVQRKYSKDLQDPSQRMLLGAFADLNNSKKSWDDSKRAEEFEGRKEAIKKSYEQMDEYAELTPRGWGRDNKDYMELYKKLVDQLDSFNSVEDIWNSLNRGHQELYKVSREFYDRILPETKQNGEIDNNTIFDTEYQGTYFPRSYMPLDTKVRKQEQTGSTQPSILDQMAEGNTFNATSTEVRGAEVSGAKRARTLTGSQLSPDIYIDLDFMANFLRESKKMLYDVETQAERRYVARVMHSTELLQIFGDKDALEIFRNAVIQKMENDLIATTSRGTKSAIRNITDEIYGLNVNLALGGVAQAAKQAVPQLVDTGFRLGKNQGLLYIGMYMYANGGAFGHLMEGSTVRFRNVRNVEVRDNLLSQKEVSYIKRFVDSRLGKLGEKGKEIRDFVTIGPLTFGDDFAAKSSWYAHYLDYLERNNLLKYTPDGMMDLAEVNTDALAYADLQVNLSNNESDPAMKAKLFSGTTGAVVRTVFPFISFPLNSKMELIRNLERAVDGDAHTTEQKKALGRNIGANIANILIYGAIGEIIRDKVIQISGAVISDLVVRFEDLDEEEEEKLLAILEKETNELREANKRNSQEYLIKDLLFGSMASQFTDPFYDLGTKLYYSAKGDEEALEELSNRGRPSELWDLAFDAMGGYGIFPRTGRRFYTSFSEWHLTDAEWRTRKFGIEDEMGEALVVPFDKEGIKRPLFSRYAYGIATIAHGTPLFTGASWQTISGTVRRIQRLAKKAEQELHGRDVGKLKEIKSLKTVTIGDEKVELNEEQFERVKKIRTAVVRRMTLGEVNPVLTTLEEEYGLELPEITRHELGLAAGERVAIETIRKIATDFAKDAIILEDNLLEGLEEKERVKAEKELRRHNEAVEAYIEALNLGKTTPEEYEKRKVKK